MVASPNDLALRSGAAGHRAENQMSNRGIARRLEGLEKEDAVGGIGKSRRMPLIIASLASGGLNKDRCLQILEECGFLHAQTDLVNFCAIPTGLNEQEMERFLRKRGAEICYPRNAPNFGVPIAGVRRDDDPVE
jgi:hypothetical protein